MNMEPTQTSPRAILQHVRWPDVKRARSVALACRLDRRLQEASEAGSRPEVGLAEALRHRLAVAAAGDEGQLLDTIEAVHEQLAHLPKPPLPPSMRVFFGQMFGQGWDASVVVSPTERPRWPLGGVDGAEVVGGLRGAGDGAYPVAVIPQADLHNPLMWPLIGLQAAPPGAPIDLPTALARRLGPGMFFARAEALAAADADGAPSLWEQGRQLMMTEAYAEAEQLAEQLADGVLVSAHRRGQPMQRSGGTQGHGGAGVDNPVYEQLAQVRDEPAAAADILQAGWLHWYSRGLERVVGWTAAGRDDWHDVCRFVHAIDDLLCRSLDVAAIHSFYASGGTDI